MKKFIILGLFLIAGTYIYAQPSKVQEIFNKYGGKDGFTTVSLTDPSVALGGDIDAEMKKAISDINSMKILTYDTKKNVNKKLGEEFANDLKKINPSEGYKEFMSVNDGGTYVRMYSKKQGNSANEFFMIVIEKNDSYVLIWISGSGALNMNNVGKIGKLFGLPDDGKAKKGGKNKEE